VGHRERDLNKFWEENLLTSLSEQLFSPFLELKKLFCGMWKRKGKRIIKVQDNIVGGLMDSE